MNLIHSNKLRLASISQIWKLLFIGLPLMACESAKNEQINQVEIDGDLNTEVSLIVGSCSYTNIFSSSSECRNYTGEGWTSAQAQSDCIVQQDSSFSDEGCEMSSALGQCVIMGESDLDYELVLSGSAPDECQTVAEGCVIFARGAFVPSAVCEGQYEPIEPFLPSEVGDVFVPSELICIEGESNSAQEKKCTWQSIGGCAPKGELFTDYASCTPVLTQRPYAPVPASGFDTPADDPIRTDSAYLEEVEWVRAQAKACGCVCCHEGDESPSGAAVWDTDREGLWLDDWNPQGLAMGAGWLDSSALGAFDAENNNGFDRSMTVLPTTDVERMVRFFEGELARRGYVPEDFANESPVGGPLYEQTRYVPSTCENGEGIKSGGKITWNGGGARYVYILSADSTSPGVPPNLDIPEGTIWKVDVDHRSASINELTYGVVPNNARQAYPNESMPMALEVGQSYYLYVLRDISAPITRCLFTYDETAESPENNETNGPWAQTCSADDDCSSPTDFCVMAPGDPEGYCSVHCDSASACLNAGAPSSWACVALSCENEAFTWCGEPSEVEESGGFLKLCP